MIEHIELHSENRLALPVTETAYRSHFIPIGSIEQEGGAVAYVTAWLDFEVERTRWRGAQLSFFREVEKSRPAPGQPHRARRPWFENIDINSA